MKQNKQITKITFPYVMNKNKEKIYCKLSNQLNQYVAKF